MEFWSRLIGGASNQKQHSPAANTPQQRLQRFRRAYNPVLQLSSRPQNSIASNSAALEQLRLSFHRIAAILREETRTPAPHLCLSFAASAQIYSVIARAASTSQNELVIREAIAVFAVLVDSEEEDFLASAVFAKSLMRFVARVTDYASIGHDTEAELIEVLFNVAAKIRIQPDILPVWFNTTTIVSQTTHSHSSQKDHFAGATQKDDFPLCYLLIDRIHHEGRTGDFARTGLLYIFEAASRSPTLENWIVGSDLPTLMASGLGALYSQLSRELSIRHEPEHLPLMLAMSDYVDAQPLATAESIYSMSHGNHMATFLSHLAFWQDVLEHCKSNLVKETLLDHFQVLFLQQLLYPSLLQSSDTDGGSSVAVLTYVANILEALDHPDLVHMILHYLLAMSDGASPKSSHPPERIVATRRQSSLILLNDIPDEEENVNPNLFSLVDLILNGVQSRNSQTAVAALKLSSVLFNRHSNYALTTLVKVKLPTNITGQRTVGALSVESEDLMNIAASISQGESLDDAYATALQDITPSLELQLVQQTVRAPAMTLIRTDPFLLAVSTLFQSFFTNNIEVNLALTEAVIQLALRAQVSPSGWLAASPSCYLFEVEDQLDLAVDLALLDEDEKAAFHGLREAHRRPHWEYQDAPLLPSLLRQLQAQVHDIRHSIANIDTLIAKRIEILGGIESDDPITRPVSRQARGRLSSDVADSVRSYSVGESRQVQRLKAGSAASSRRSSPGRSQTPSRNHDLSKSHSRGSETLSVQPTTGRLSHGIFQPPPPDPADDATSISNTSGISSLDVPEYEAETLQRKLRFGRKATSLTDIFAYVIPISGGVDEEQYEEREASTSHVLTNFVILHYFLLELVAVLRTRAVMFDEVVFS